MINIEDEDEKFFDEYLKLEDKWENLDEFVFFKKLNPIEQGIYIRAKKYSLDDYIKLKKIFEKMYKKLLIIDILMFFIVSLLSIIIFIKI